MAQAVDQYVYLNQELTLNFTDTDDIDMDTVDFRVDYWKPSNQTDTPDATVGATEITTTPGSPIVNIKVLKDLLDEPSNRSWKWRFQIVDNVSQIAWNPMSVDVKIRGT
jgi:hypothetical protein